MKNTKNQKNLTILLTLILIFTIIWVITNVYHSLKSSTIDIPVRNSITPIDGKFDTKTIDQLKTRIRVDISNDIINLSEDSLDEETVSSTPAAQIDTENGIDTGTSSGELEL